MNNDVHVTEENGSKKSSHCFRNLLRSKKVGFFNAEKSIMIENSLENMLGNNGNCNGGKSNGTVVSQTFKRDGNNEEESKITNVALCCAITDTGKTPVTFRCMGGNTKCAGDSYQRSNKPEDVIVVHPYKNTMEINKTNFSTDGEVNRKKSNEDTNNADDSEEKSQLATITPSPKSKIKYNCGPYFNEIFKDRAMIKNCVQNNSSISESCKQLKFTDRSFSKNKQRPRSVSLFPQKSSSLNSLRHESIDSSLESLIKHTIAGSRVMYPVSVEKAKDRNYLYGKTGALSLLGASELERIFPERGVRIYISTWNMNGEAPPSDLSELLLPSQIETLPDIYVIGTQESYHDKSEWEISVQETIGPSHVLFHSETLGTLYLGVFIRRELIWFCSEPEDTSMSTRPGSAFKTKGAVAICFYLFGSSFLFITSHLTAHDDKVKERIHDIKRISKSLELPKELPIRHRNKDVTQNFEYVFWCGDLNFRLTQPRAQVIDWLSKQKFPLESPTQTPLYDQLSSSIRKGLVFKGFQEAPLTFKPTYKYDPGTQNFDTSHKQRVPSYTDRILYKCKRGSSILATSNNVNIQWVYYNSVPSFTTSDHKPVWGLYKCKLRPGSDSIPLAAGLFNREVYLDGLKRRARSRKKSKTIRKMASRLIKKFLDMQYK